MGYALNLYSRGFGAPARDLEITIYVYIVYLYIYMYICTHMIIIRNNRKPRYFCCRNFFLNNNSFVKQLAKKGIHKEAEAQKIVPEPPRKSGQRLCTSRSSSKRSLGRCIFCSGCVCFCIFGLVLSYSLQRIVSEDQRSSFKRKV